MSLAALDSIAQAEENARKIRADAAADAKKAVRDAEEAAADAVSQAGAKADAEVQELIRKAETEAKFQTDELAGVTQGRKADMRARADRKMEQVVAMVVERIVNG